MLDTGQRGHVLFNLQYPFSQGVVLLEMEKVEYLGDGLLKTVTTDKNREPIEPVTWFCFSVRKRWTSSFRYGALFPKGDTTVCEGKQNST